METKVIAISVIAVLLILGGSLFLTRGSGTTQSTLSSNQQTTQTTIPSNQQPSTTVSATLFANSQLEPYSYLISSVNLTPQAQFALSGYSLTRNALQNGTVDIGISSVGRSLNHTFVLPSGYKLYVVEVNTGEDAPSYDGSLSDDAFLVVDANGYIASGWNGSLTGG